MFTAENRRSVEMADRALEVAEHAGLTALLADTLVTKGTALGELGLRGMPLVFGAMRGKRVHAILRSLSQVRPQLIFTAVDEPGARSPDELLAIWRSLGGVRGRTAPDPRDALRMAAALVRDDEPILVAGSLYLVGAVRGMLTGEES